MKKNFFFLPLVFIALLLAACSPTDVTGVWMDKDYDGGVIKKVLVVGVFKQDGIRRKVEDALVLKLSEKNVEAVASYRVLSGSELSGKKGIEFSLEKGGFDSLLIATVTEKRKEGQITQGAGYGFPASYHNSWDSYYARSRGFVGRPGYDTPFHDRVIPARVTTRDIYSLETNLYHASGKNLVLSVLSDVYTGLPVDKLITSFVGTVIKKLSENNLL